MECCQWGGGSIFSNINTVTCDNANRPQEFKNDSMNYLVPVLEFCEATQKTKNVEKGKECTPWTRRRFGALMMTTMFIVLFSETNGW